MVQLKEGMETSFAAYTTFQFHYGSIKSELDLTALEFEINFNSTMVQLKA